MPEPMNQVIGAISIVTLIVGARIEVAQLRRQLAESTAPDVIAGQP